MEMLVKVDGEEIFVILCGEIDHHEAASLRKQIDDLIFEERPRCLTFDFSGVKFMDSSGIGLVLGRYRLLNALGARTIILGASKSIEKIFKMSGVDKIIELVK